MSNQILLATVSVTGLEVQAEIGINDDEFSRSQKLRVDVILTIEPVLEDKIGATVDYRDIERHAEKLGRSRVGLIETFAHRLAAVCLMQPHVIVADVSIAKPSALSNGLAATRIRLAKPR